MSLLGGAAGAGVDDAIVDRGDGGGSTEEEREDRNESSGATSNARHGFSSVTTGCD
jgi:hypothetical protein